MIYQSAEAVRASTPKRSVSFNVCVVGHLREEEDPLRTVIAVRNLSHESRIQVTHVGQALDSRLGAEATAEAARNPRYCWIGQLSHRRTRTKMAASDLVCITSKMEGSSNVLSEALASAVPVVASKIPGLVGTLGAKFPGYYPCGDTAKLRRLLLKLEEDRAFYRALKRYCRDLAYLVKPKRELDSWRKLIREIV